MDRDIEYYHKEAYWVLVAPQVVAKAPQGLLAEPADSLVMLEAQRAPLLALGNSLEAARAQVEQTVSLTHE